MVLKHLAGLPLQNLEGSTRYLGSLWCGFLGTPATTSTVLCFHFLLTTVASGRYSDTSVTLKDALPSKGAGVLIDIYLFFFIKLILFSCWCFFLYLS